MIKIEEYYENNYAIRFCDNFTNSTKPKFVFGRNEFAKSIGAATNIDGYIDEYTNDREYFGKPIFSINDIPNDAFVVSAVVVGKPLIAEKKIKKFQFQSLDYFSFLKYSNLPLAKIPFWEGFVHDFTINRSKYEWIYEQLNDGISKNQYYNIINFRLSHNIDFMRGFSAIEDKQYFEAFLNLSTAGESFADIGAFDGYTSEEFIKRCPQYDRIYLFEPEEENIDIAQNRLKYNQNIHFHQIGLSSKKQTLKFDVSGSSSKISDTGSIVIEVDKLDALIKEPITFLKMDIEGGEADAIEGAKEIIMSYHPKLAISAYHNADDLWKIPEQILAIRNDYSIFLRHYTEGFAETVLFFIPKK